MKMYPVHVRNSEFRHLLLKCLLIRQTLLFLILSHMHVMFMPKGTTEEFDRHAAADCSSIAGDQLSREIDHYGTPGGTSFECRETLKSVTAKWTVSGVVFEGQLWYWRRDRTTVEHSTAGRLLEKLRKFPRAPSPRIAENGSTTADPLFARWVCRRNSVADHQPRQSWMTDR